MKTVHRKDDNTKRKITSLRIDYPKNQHPNVLEPKEYESYRFLIGKDGINPLVAICMNPSAANDDKSDRTVNRIISISEKLNYTGWFIVNTYPERATDAKCLNKYDESLAQKNTKIIEQFLLKKNIKEVWGAWGDLKFDALRKGKKLLLKMLKKNGIKIFCFGDLTDKGNPRHPLRLASTAVSQEGKNYDNIK